MDSYHLRTKDRLFEDWKRQAKPEEVVASVRPEKGKVLFFDHRICHDVEKYLGNKSRIIIRGDIVFWALEKSV